MALGTLFVSYLCLMKISLKTRNFILFSLQKHKILSQIIFIPSEEAKHNQQLQILKW